VVYRGYSRAKDTLVAIKVVKSTELSRREIETLRALSSLDHPNIMGFYGDIEVNGNTFLVLEYCNRGTLAELIRQGISELQALKLFREIVEGMCYMNARGTCSPMQRRCIATLSPITFSSVPRWTPRFATSDWRRRPTASS
jgi:serine/threonine-protein kinase